MKIQALDREISDLLGSAFFRIPRFQRPYSWLPEHIEDFWNDTIINSEADYFIGSMVVFLDQDSRRFEIVDGQQRLTTITMLLAAVRNAYSEAGFHDLASGVHQLIERRDLTNKPKFVLETDAAYPHVYLREHIQRCDAPPEVVGPTNDEDKSLAKGWQFIQTLVGDAVRAIKEDSTLSDDKKRAGIEKKLMGIRNQLLALKLIQVTVDNEDDSVVIFETLNARGMDLQTVDMVKAHLTKLLKPANPQLDTARDKWNHLRTLLADGSINANTFIHHWWLSRHEYVTLHNLYQKFRRSVRKKDVAKAVLDDLSADAVTYREVVDLSYRKWTAQEAEVARAIEALSVFRVTQPLPMVLAVMRAYRKRELALKQVRDVLEAIESFHFTVNAVAGQSSSGGISAMYASAARQLYEAKDAQARARVIQELRRKLKARRPSLAEFEAGFDALRFTDEQSQQRRLVKYILSRLDGAHESGAAIDYNQMTIEHVAPQNPNGPAAVVPEQVGKLGNLLLVSKEMNRKLANKTFAQKLPILKSAKSWVDDRIRSSTTWTAAQIDSRTRELATVAYTNIWTG